MKKLLVLMLIVGFSSSAFGLYGDVRDDFQLQLNGTTLTVVGLSTDPLEVGVFTPDPDTTGYMFSGPAVVLGDGVGGNAAGALGSIWVYNSGGYDGFEFLTGDTSPSSDPVDLGPWFTVQYYAFPCTGRGLDVYTNIATTYDYVGYFAFLNPCCIAGNHPDRSEWDAVGRPNWWCNPRQCRGDADGLQELIGHTYFWVGFVDLGILIDNWADAQGIPAAYQADFSHSAETIGHVSCRVGFDDLTILVDNWADAQGSPADCLEVP